MTTEDLEKLAINHPDIFIEWVRINHGDHGTLPNTECEAARQLAFYDDDLATIEQVLEAVIEVESGDWYESWEQFLTDKNII